MPDAEAHLSTYAGVYLSAPGLYDGTPTLPLPHHIEGQYAFAPKNTITTVLAMMRRSNHNDQLRM